MGGERAAGEASERTLHLRGWRPSELIKPIDCAPTVPVTPAEKSKSSKGE